MKKIAFTNMIFVVLSVLVSCKTVALEKEASSQTDEAVEELNSRGFWTPYTQWIQDDDKMESYLRMLNEKSAGQLKQTLEMLETDHERAQGLLNVRKGIGKSSRRLANRFKDVEAAKRAFEAAEQAERRYERMKKAINLRLDKMEPAVMPAGRLLYFSYDTSNAFAAYKHEITLDGRKGKHELKVEEGSMIIYEGQEKPQKPEPKEVADSVFQRVRNMIEQGQLYDVGRYYMPDFDILDASRWGLEMEFEQGRISTGGYAAGPDHHETLHAILDYLTAIFKGGDEEKE